MKQKANHIWTRKARKGIRRKGILWCYNGDGMFSREKVKGADKRYWRRWIRRVSKEIDE